MVQESPEARRNADRSSNCLRVIANEARNHRCDGTFFGANN